MPQAPLMDDPAIEAALRNVRGWANRERGIEKTFRFKDFREALAFVNRVAEPAEEQNHHPDVAIHWNEVTLTLWTHAAGGLTERDFRLAASIDALTKE